MKKANRLRLLGAGAMMIAGGAWAASIASAPTSRGLDAAALRALASRLEQTSTTRTLRLEAPAPVARPAAVFTSEAAPVFRASVPARASGPMPVLPPAAVVGNEVLAVAPAPEVPEPASAREDPVKNIALLGVTLVNGTEQAWLIDVSSRTKEAASEGHTALGFTVEDIQGERVLLALGDREFMLRLGDQALPAERVERLEADDRDAAGAVRDAE